MTVCLNQTDQNVLNRDDGWVEATPLIKAFVGRYDSKKYGNIPKINNSKFFILSDRKHRSFTDSDFKISRNLSRVSDPSTFVVNYHSIWNTLVLDKHEPLTNCHLQSVKKYVHP